MATALDVAKYVLEQQGRITTLKLEKLVYYAQAWSVADGQPIFADPVKAWEQGPVVPPLFHAHKSMRYVDADRLGGDSAALSPAEVDTIDYMLAFYGDLPAPYLRALTHHEKPWKDAREAGERRGHASPLISVQAMRAFYRGKTPEQLNADFQLAVASRLMDKHAEALARLAQ
jgi:uncharacterized phage-associated protein